jgi:hypothetical protein
MTKTKTFKKAKRKDDSAFINEFLNHETVAMRLTGEILDCDYLPEDKKLLALEDLLRMSTDSEYADRTRFIGQMNHRRKDSCSINHLWSGSDLGWDFWNRMDDILYGREGYNLFWIEGQRQSEGATRPYETTQIPHTHTHTHQKS